MNNSIKPKAYLLFSSMFIEAKTRTSFDKTIIDLSRQDINLTQKTGIGRRHSSSSLQLSNEFSYSIIYQALKPDEVDISSSVVKNNSLQFSSSELPSIKFPILKCLARKLYSIPATSAGTERLFSYRGIILNSKRQRLSSDQLDNIQVRRSARKVLGNIQKAD